MSGHSKWHNIKYRKERSDAQKSKIFSKLAKAIAISARSGSESSLQKAIDQAKEFNMPKVNIERAIQKQEEAGALEEITYQAIGPHNLGILIEAITDNKNRTLSEIKHILKKHDAQLGNVSWMFESKTKPKYPIILEPNQKQQVENLFAELDDQDDVQEIYSNLNL